MSIARELTKFNDEEIRAWHQMRLPETPVDFLKSLVDLVVSLTPQLIQADATTIATIASSLKNQIYNSLSKYYPKTHSDKNVHAQAKRKDSLDSFFIALDGIILIIQLSDSDNETKRIVADFLILIHGELPIRELESSADFSSSLKLIEMFLESLFQHLAKNADNTAEAHIRNFAGLLNAFIEQGLKLYCPNPNMSAEALMTTRSETRNNIYLSVQDVVMNQHRETRNAKHADCLKAFYREYTVRHFFHTNRLPAAPVHNPAAATTPEEQLSHLSLGARHS